MADRMTKEQRHRCMSRIKGKDTKPEMLVRRYLHSRGYRYRVNVRRLPGTPDIVLRKEYTQNEYYKQEQITIQDCISYKNRFDI